MTYIYGIGRSASKTVLEKAGVDRDIKVKDWTDAQAAAVREVIQRDYKVEVTSARKSAQHQAPDGHRFAIAASVTVWASPSADRAPRTMRAPARARKKTVANKKKATK